MALPIELDPGDHRDELHGTKILNEYFETTRDSLFNLNILLPLKNYFDLKIKDQVSCIL